MNQFLLFHSHRHDLLDVPLGADCHLHRGRAPHSPLAPPALPEGNLQARSPTAQPQVERLLASPGLSTQSQLTQASKSKQTKKKQNERFQSFGAMFLFFNMVRLMAFLPVGNAVKAASGATVR